ncbi:MAG: helical backbone metal receptor [Polyangiaceae bacterium]
MRTEPQSIVSLVPSDTYNLCRLGLGDRLVGRTEYCIEPGEDVRDIEVLGGPKNPNITRILALEPDLVVANQEENTQRDVEALQRAGLDVYLSFPKTVAEGIQHVERLAALFPSLGLQQRARVDDARETVAALTSRDVVAVPTFVPIWMDPLMTANGATFVSDVLELCGARNVFSDRERRYPLAADLGLAAALPSERVGDRDVRYPRVSEAEVIERSPRLILLPSEPYAFTDAEEAYFRNLPLPAPHRVRRCEGQTLTWYGLRCIEGLAELQALIDDARQ